MNIKFKINKKISQKIISCMLLAIFFIMLSGCSKDTSEKNNVNFEQITAGIKGSVNDETITISANPSKSLKRFYGLNLSDYENLVLYSPSSSMDVSELMIIKLSDDTQIDAVESSIEARVASQLESFGGYGPEQCALLEDYIIKIKNNYVFYAVGKNAENLKKAFIDAI